MAQVRNIEDSLSFSFSLSKGSYPPQGLTYASESVFGQPVRTSLCRDDEGPVSSI